MAGTFTQLYIHIVFAVKHRAALFHRSWRDELEQYVTGIVENHGHKLLAVGAQPDHIHIFIGQKPVHSIPKLVEEIKTSTNHWIKEKKFCRFKFDWQIGYGAFSHSRSQLSVVIQYVRNQDSHHRKQSFREEYLAMLLKNDIAFEEKYVFEFFPDVLGWAEE